MKYLHGSCYLIVVLFLSIMVMETSCKGGNKYKQAVWKESDTSRCGARIPKSTGLINDFGNVYTGDQIKVLDSICRSFSAKGNGQMTVVTIGDALPDQCDIKDYATDLGNNWGVGNKEKNDGVVIVISLFERKIAIANGTGIEKIFTDRQAKNIVDSVFIPLFKKGDYYEASRSGLLAIDDHISKAR